MDIYEITAVRPYLGDYRARYLDAVKIGYSWFLVDQIIHWIEQETHQFHVSYEGQTYQVVVGWHSSSQRHYLTTEGCGFPPVVLLSLPRA